MSATYIDNQGIGYSYSPVSSGTGSASVSSGYFSGGLPGTVPVIIPEAIYPDGTGKPGYNVIAIEGYGVLQGPINPLTISGVIQNFAYNSLSYLQNATGQPTLSSLTFDSDNGTDDSLQSAPGGITQNTDGTSYVDSNQIFVNSLTNDAIIQVPGYKGQYIYSTSIVEAIQYDYPDSLITFNYNAVTTTQGIDYVFRAT